MKLQKDTNYCRLKLPYIVKSAILEGQRINLYPKTKVFKL